MELRWIGSRALEVPEPWLIGVAIFGNCVLTVASFYLAWRLWRWRQALITLTALLEYWHGQLGQTVKPASLQPAQNQIAHLKQTYGRLSQQLQTGGQILAWLGLGWRLSRGWWRSTQVRGKVTHRQHHRRREKR